MYLNVLQYQWLILALLGGVSLLLAIVAAYLMMWRPRNPSHEPIQGGLQQFQWIPFILITLLICIVIFQFAYTIILSMHPANI
jgi:hypothetical protein